MNLRNFFALLLFFFIVQCKPGNESTNDKKTEVILKPKPRIEIHYSFEVLKKGALDSFKKKFTTEQFSKILALNRIDENNLYRIDTLIVPDNFEAELIQYSPFPLSLSFLGEVKKIVFFSYASQSFAVYNSGVLVHWGPSNMGSKAHPTPTGMYYANWKAEETKSTFNDEWILKWNVNLDNKEGIGWHEYTMPGFPASHSCLRLLEADAKYLYEWVDEWILLNDETILTKGTPTVVFGTYPFGRQKPWTLLLHDPHALDIQEDILKNEVMPFLEDIKHWKQVRDSINKSEM